MVTSFFRIGINIKLTHALDASFGFEIALEAQQLGATLYLAI
jgi:hypothetical protein